MSVDPAVAWILRLCLALLLAGAALAKLRDPGGFARALAGYRMLPAAALAPAARALPALELALAAGLLVLPGRGAPASAALFALYAAAIAWNLARGRRHIDCGCGGPGGRLPIQPALVARNLALVGAALAAGAAPSGRPLALLDGFTVVAGATALALLWASLDVALANRARLAGARLAPQEATP
jgi:hypothetical protein